jgi:hypothetical protein
VYDDSDCAKKPIASVLSFFDLRLPHDDADYPGSALN